MCGYLASSFSQQTWRLSIRHHTHYMQAHLSPSSCLCLHVTIAAIATMATTQSSRAAMITDTATPLTAATSETKETKKSCATYAHQKLTCYTIFNANFCICVWILACAKLHWYGKLCRPLETKMIIMTSSLNDTWYHSTFMFDKDFKIILHWHWDLG